MLYKSDETPGAILGILLGDATLVLFQGKLFCVSLSSSDLTSNYFAPFEQICV